MTVLVTGATGAVGRHLVDALLREGEAVRALTRHPDAAALPNEVEVVRADLAAGAPVPPAVFDGVDAVFVFPLQAGVPALVEAAVAGGARRFVVLSSLAVSAEFPRDERSVSRLHHQAVEHAVTARTDGWTMLRPGTFANNLLAWSYPIRTRGSIRAPYLDSAQAPIHEADVADAATHALVTDGLAGRVLTLTGPEALTRRQQVEVIARAIGRDVAVEEITSEAFRTESAAFVPGPVLDMLLDYWHDTVEAPDVPRPVTAVTGRPGRTLQQWADDHRADFGG